MLTCRKRLKINCWFKDTNTEWENYWYVSSTWTERTICTVCIQWMAVGLIYFRYCMHNRLSLSVCVFHSSLSIFSREFICPVVRIICHRRCSLWFISITIAFYRYDEISTILSQREIKFLLNFSVIFSQCGKGQNPSIILYKSKNKIWNENNIFFQ